VIITALCHYVLLTVLLWPIGLLCRLVRKAAAGSSHRQRQPAAAEQHPMYEVKAAVLSTSMRTSIPCRADEDFCASYHVRHSALPVATLWLVKSMFAHQHYCCCCCCCRFCTALCLVRPLAAAQLSLLTLFLINLDVNALVTSSMAVYPMATILLIKYGECCMWCRQQCFVEMLGEWQESWSHINVYDAVGG
jgi:hypothetical protein